jgi:hypothetical protein
METTWHATHYHRRALKADTTMIFSVEPKTHLRPPFTAVAVPHKRNAYWNDLFQILRSGDNCRYTDGFLSTVHPADCIVGLL